MRSMADTWEHLDALALESVGDAASEGVSLSRMIGLIDYVDRTVLNHHEAERTLRRLYGSGLVEENQGLIRRSAAGQRVHDSCPPTAPREKVRCVQNHLLSKVPNTPSAEWSLSREAFESALTEYHEEMRRIIDRQQ
jgi:hypothetical protein